MGSSYELSVQWTADGVTTSEALGTVNFNEEMTKPTIIWATGYTSLDYGYYLRRTGKTNYLTLTCYPVELEVDAPAWMDVAAVEVDLRLNGDAGEPAATAVLQTEGAYSVGSTVCIESVWDGTFYEDNAANEWEYTGQEQPCYVARVTDTNGNVWTSSVSLTQK